MVKRIMSVTIRRLSNQSWFEIKAGDCVAHIDPAYVSVAKRGAVPGDKADLILLTHAHMDHCDRRAVEDFSHDNTMIAGPSSVARKLRRSIHTMSPDDEIAMGEIRVRATAAYNLGAIRHLLHRKSTCVGYLVTAGGMTIYHAGDTDFIPEMSSLGPVDVALLPISGMVTMNIEDAVKAAIAIGPKVVVPMHQNRADPTLFREKMISAAPGITVVLMKAGDELTI
jgi:L-ascorbate metabolism protein UlaG (beta-lactamase superfamily)